MIHLDPRDLARQHPHILTNLNQDVDKDGSIDIALQGTCGLPSGATVGEVADYEFEWSEASSAGGTYTVRETTTSPTGRSAIKANSEKFYKMRVRAISWNGTKGNWSALSAAIQPSGTTGAPASPTIGSPGLVSVPGGFEINWFQPTELDYAFTEIAWLGSPGTPTSAAVFFASSARHNYVFFPEPTIAAHIYVRHVNTSGLRSGWTYFGSVTPSRFIRMDGSNFGTSNSASVNAGLGTKTFLCLTFKATSNTAGVTINLGGQSWTVDYEDQKPFTFTTMESTGGSWSFSKSGGGTQANGQLTAITCQ